MLQFVTIGRIIGMVLMAVGLVWLIWNSSRKRTAQAALVTLGIGLVILLGADVFRLIIQH
ncbi:hypothetical protein [Levilactobacillus bambusae]|uniref:Uncharacterized protein n=1 Tax=Levilactobacillus bambusae TaxID=2024736 RepID=A0A2V1N4D1_9LACO|nr:hypothetical protein [Levilactobacillus bambusae]PWG00700.1 hypothetical protein DCM90_00555 [Levilactobacillus bambusae]